MLRSGRHVIITMYSLVPSQVSENQFSVLCVQTKNQNQGMFIRLSVLEIRFRGHVHCIQTDNQVLCAWNQ
jgi:hypothetical protein